MEDACSSSSLGWDRTHSPRQNRSLCRVDGRISSIVRAPRTEKIPPPPPGIESERIVGERYGKTVGLTVLRPSKNCPTMMAGLRFDPRWILKRSNWLLGNSEAANCRRGGKKSSGKKEWRGEMKIVLFL